MKIACRAVPAQLVLERTSHRTVPNFVPTCKPDELPASVMRTVLNIHLEVISSNSEQILVIAVSC
jgi:hypothetical protein